MVEFAPGWLQWPQTQALKAALGSGHLRFVGGCVRDGLLGRRVNDVDCATTWLPNETLQLLESAGIQAIPTGIDHGTVTAVIDKRHFEITTLRRDVETDGRHATVAYTDSWQEDAARRDFTINALYCDADGKLYDYFGGMQDALGGKVRFIGSADARITEDALRILRFFRFFAHYGQGELDGAGIAACTAHTALIRSLSGERIAQEMLKLFTATSAGQVVDTMQQSGVWEEIVPAKVGTKALCHLPALLKRAGHAPDGILAFASLLRSVKSNSATLIDAIALRWKLSRAQHKRLQLLCAASVALANTEEAQWKIEIRKHGKEDFIDHMLLGMAEGTCMDTGLAAIALARNWIIPQFPVSGNDLIALGITPGQEMGRLLIAMEKAWETAGYGSSKQEILEKHALNILK